MNWLHQYRKYEQCRVRGIELSVRSVTVWSLQMPANAINNFKRIKIIDNAL